MRNQQNDSPIFTPLFRTLSKLNQQQQTYCTDILTSSTRLLSLVNNILDLAMIESGHIQLKRENCDFWALFDETLQNYNQQCDPLLGVLKATIPVEKAIIQGDKKHLKQALETLLMQAISDIECNDDVIFKMTQEEETLSVNITLPVYAKKNQHKAQSDHNTILMCHLAPGKTLGLSLARHIIEAHGATFEHITSSPEKTRIKLIFPLSQVNRIPLRAVGNA